MQALRKTLSNERGGAGLSATIAIAIVAACVYVGVQLIPIYWGHWNFEDNMKTLTQYAFVNITGDVKVAVEKEVKKGLDELGADYKNKDVKVKVDTAKKKIIIDAAYTKTEIEKIVARTPLKSATVSESLIGLAITGIK